MGLHHPGGKVRRSPRGAGAAGGAAAEVGVATAMEGANLELD